MQRYSKTINEARLLITILTYLLKNLARLDAIGKEFLVFTPFLSLCHTLSAINPYNKSLASPRIPGIRSQTMTKSIVSETATPHERLVYRLITPEGVKVILSYFACSSEDNG